MSKQQEYSTHSARQTQRLAADFARRLRAGDLITLQGELGAGKTTFAQGLAQGLNVPAAVLSPTFVLLVEYEACNDAGSLPLLHLDAYRLEGALGETICLDALADAGVLDMLAREDAIKLVEWPERIAEVLPAPRFTVAIVADDGDERHITITDCSKTTAAP